MNSLKLYMLLIGCKPEGRFTEQHDVFFGIGTSLKELIPHIHDFWPEAKSTLHIDAWREVTSVDGHEIRILPRDENQNEVDESADLKLFFLNLGGYKKDEFEEYHSKMLVIAGNSSKAIKQAKQTIFYKETGFKGAASHIDDKYALDVDDIYPVEDILNASDKTKYRIKLLVDSAKTESDQIHLGYLQLSKIKE
ncbi:MAG: DUF1543 domain-containing protein [Bacteroidetes bacterium]|nr:DUF1543 domain-containing protein [Bacteroidota bacterium]